MPETVNLKEAIKIVKKPRNGDAVFPYKKPKFQVDAELASVGEDMQSEQGMPLSSYECNIVVIPGIFWLITVKSYEI